MTEVPERPGAFRRTVLRTYGRLPRWVRLALLHALTPSHTVGALCLMEHEGRLLMLRQHHRHGWTLPGGLVDRGEDAATAVIREMREETGLAVEVGLPFAAVVDPRARRVDVLFHIPVDTAPAVTVGSEAITASWVEPHRAGAVDDPTAQALAAFTRSRDEAAYRGRLVTAP